MTSAYAVHPDDIGERTGSDTTIHEGTDRYGRRVYLVGNTGKWAATLAKAERIVRRMNNPRAPRASEQDRHEEERARREQEWRDLHDRLQDPDEIIPF